MKNVAVIPDVLSETSDLLDSICRALPAKGTQEDVLNAVVSHRTSIKKISKKSSKLLKSLDLEEKVQEKYNELKKWSIQQNNYAFPVIAWNYFTHTIVYSTEDNIVQNIVCLLPIVEMAFKDYYLN